jgi:hypothetical protein
MRIVLVRDAKAGAICVDCGRRSSRFMTRTAQVTARVGLCNDKCCCHPNTTAAQKRHCRLESIIDPTVASKIAYPGSFRFKPIHFRSSMSGTRAHAHEPPSPSVSTSIVVRLESNARPLPSQSRFHGSLRTNPLKTVRSNSSKRGLEKVGGTAVSE